MEQVLQIVARACDNKKIAVDTELLDSGLLDSFALIAMLVAFEDELGVELQPTQLAREVWRTPESIAAAVIEAQGQL